MNTSGLRGKLPGNRGTPIFPPALPLDSPMQRLESRVFRPQGNKLILVDSNERLPSVTHRHHREMVVSRSIQRHTTGYASGGLEASEHRGIYQNRRHQLEFGKNSVERRQYIEIPKTPVSNRFGEKFGGKIGEHFGETVSGQFRQNIGQAGHMKSIYPADSMVIKPLSARHLIPLDSLSPRVTWDHMRLTEASYPPPESTQTSAKGYSEGMLEHVRMQDAPNFFVKREDGPFQEPSHPYHNREIHSQTRQPLAQFHLSHLPRQQDHRNPRDPKHPLIPRNPERYPENLRNPWNVRDHCYRREPRGPLDPRDPRDPRDLRNPRNRLDPRAGRRSLTQSVRPIPVVVRENDAQRWESNITQNPTYSSKSRNIPVMMENSHELKKYACSLCNRKFKLRGNLKAHFRTHTGEKPFKCRVCERHFSHASNRNRHEVRQHGRKQSTKRSNQPKTKPTGTNDGSQSQSKRLRKSTIIAHVNNAHEREEILRVDNVSKSSETATITSGTISKVTTEGSDYYL